MQMSETALKAMADLLDLIAKKREIQARLENLPFSERYILVEDPAEAMELEGIGFFDFWVPSTGGVRNDK